MPVDLNKQQDVAQVRRFWDAHPLCDLESDFKIGTKEFFDWHEKVRFIDVEAFSSHLHEFELHEGELVLDVGCGIGWLCRNFVVGGAKTIGIDISRRAVELAKKRLCLDGLKCPLLEANVERLPFQSDSFDFVTCCGVLHHTPDTTGGIKEIHRVLRPGGRAIISLYYKNWLLSETLWPITRILIHMFLGHVPGRRSFRHVRTVEEFVRVYDGDANPIGKCYSHHEVVTLLDDFIIERLEVHYFPRRLLPFGHLIPNWLHRVLDRFCGLMTYASVRKEV